jgi:NTE family protein
VKTTDFDIAEEKKSALILEGINGAENYFRWFENPAEDPANRLPAVESSTH